MIALAALALLSPAPCPTVVDARGPAAADLQQALTRRAIEAPTPSCPGLAVHIERLDAGFAVQRDGAQARVVPSMETAALLVETWARADLIDPLLAARAAPARPSPPAPPVVVAPAPVAPRDLHLDLGIQGGAAGDKSRWMGVAAQGCLDLGPVCVGVRGQVRIDPGLAGESERARVWRLGVGVLATGDMTLGPVRAGLGLGVASVHIDSLDGPEDDIRGAPLLQARVDHAIELSGAWALTLGVTGELALWPRRDGRQGANDEGFPGLPKGTVLAGVGVRWSSP